MSRSWRYSKDCPAGRIFDDEELDSLGDEWIDNPLPFRNPEPAIVESDEGKEIADMDKLELEAFAKSSFGVDLDRRKGVKKLRAEVQELIDGAE